VPQRRSTTLAVLSVAFELLGGFGDLIDLAYKRFVLP
jgi:hypothetical protein